MAKAHRTKAMMEGNGTGEKKYYWLKLQKSFFEDKIIKKLRRIAGGDSYLIIYLKMLVASLENDGKLFFDNLEDSVAAEVALEIDEATDNVNMALGYFCRVGLIEIDGDEINMLQLENMVGFETAAAKRMRDMRKRNNVTAERNNVTAICNKVTAERNIVQKCYTEKEIEKDKEIDIYIGDKSPAPPKKKRAVFKPPTIEEITAYCRERNNNVDPEKFFYHYEANGWKVGKNKMKSWQAAIRTWERSEFNTGNKPKTKNKFNNFEQRSYDMGLLEKQLMQKRSKS